MPLIDAIRLVRSRIESDGAYIAGHETRTRQFLIDPVLTALGWMVLDPALVILEAPAQGEGRTIRYMSDNIRCWW